MTLRILRQLGHQLRPCSAAGRRCRRAPRPVPRDSAAATASKATAPGSAPARCATTGTPSCSPQMRSCSMAAARNVSAAARITLWPSRDEPAGKLGDRGRLAGAVDPDDQDHRRRRSRARTARSRPSEPVAEHGGERGTGVGAAAARSGARAPRPPASSASRRRRRPRSAPPPPRPTSPRRWPDDRRGASRAQARSPGHPTAGGRPDPGSAPAPAAGHHPIGHLGGHVGQPQATRAGHRGIGPSSRRRSCPPPRWWRGCG